MAEIRPFVSIRPQRGKAAEIAALPYDVYNREEATKEVERHPQSFLSIDRAETQFPLSVDMYDDKVYERAHDTLWQWVGGMRASIYNAMPKEGVEKLVAFMKKFEEENANA